MLRSLATICLALFVVAFTFPFSAQAQELQAQPTRLTVQSGASGTITDIEITLDTIDTNETVNLTVDISGAVGVSSAVLAITSFTAPSDNTLDTNTTLTVTYTGTVPQTTVNEIAVIASGDHVYRLPLPINSAVIWAGDTNNTDWATSSNWEGGVVPTVSDSVVFSSSGAMADPDTNDVTSVILASDAEVASLRFSHGDDDDDESYRFEIQAGATLSVTGQGGFSMLRDTINNYDEMWVEMFGGGNLVVSNSTANWSMLGESGSADDLVLNMGGLKSFTADVDRVALGNYQGYPNYETNGYTTEPDQWVPEVTLAETNFIRTAWIGGADVITNLEERPYSFALDKHASSGQSSSQQHSLLLGRSNVFYVESMVISGGSGKGTSDGRGMEFNSNTNVIPTNVVPVVIFRGPEGSTNRMAVLAIGDASGLGGNGSSSKGKVNLTGGKVDALIDQLYVGRDRWKSRDNASGNGDLDIGGDNAVGTVFDVNTAYISAQTTGNNASDPEDDDDPSGEVNGTVDVGDNALFKVNGTIHLGYTTADADDKRQAETGGGRLRINGGTAMASNILVGGITMVSDNNVISISGGGELIVTNEIGQTNKSLNSFSMSDSTLTLHVDGSKTDPYVYTDELVTSGAGNTINVAALSGVSSFPTQLPLIDYGSASPNFGVTLPPGFFGYIVNNTDDSTIDMVINDFPPANLVWNGSPGSAWDAISANWQGGSTFINGDAVRFDETLAGSASVTISSTVFAGGSGVLVTNTATAYAFSGSGGIGGTAPMNKWGSGSLAINVKSELPLTVHEGAVTGSGAIGSTIVNSDASLNFSGAINRLASSGTATSSGSIANGVTINDGEFTSSGSITNRVILSNGDTNSPTLMTLAPGSSVTIDSPTTSRVDENTVLVMQGNSVWYNGFVKNPSLSGGQYRLDVLGTMWTGTGKILGVPALAGARPGVASRLDILDGGELHLGSTPGEIVTFTNIARFNFNTGSRVYMDVDMDSADGSNPWGSGVNGSANAKNSDVIYADWWSTMNGALVLNNIGTADYAPGTTLKLFKSGFDHFGASFGNFPESPEEQLPTMEPASPGLGMIWDLRDFRTNGVVRITGTASTPPVLMTTLFDDGENITFSWPEDHIGWELLRQTSSLTNGISSARTNWSVVSGSTATNVMTFTNWINDDLDSVFYRLAHPEFD